MRAADGVDNARSWKRALSMSQPLLSTPRMADLLGLSPGGFHRLVYVEWGDPKAPATICVHGLTRNGRDFDRLAAALVASGRRVVCPDVVGRGLSDWLGDPAHYGYPQYLADMTALIARLDTGPIDWVGTSMGGLIGLLLAAQPKTPIRRMVINDIGPFVPRAALARIATYVGETPTFRDEVEVEAYLRRIHAPFGPLADEDWRHLARHAIRAGSEGHLELHYDPAIARAFTEAPLADIDLWEAWDRISCPVLTLRGSQSDLLLAETAAEMGRRGPRAALYEIAGVGHAPMLMAPEHIALVRDWLSTASPVQSS